jgi:FKBP-type peptidyl-prolyl cis-trans isomerase
MIRPLLQSALVFGFLTVSNAQEPAAPAVPAEAPKQAIDPKALKTDSSYYLGWSTGRQFAEHGFTKDDIDTDSFLKGLLGAFEPNSDIDSEKFKNTLQAVGDLLQEREKVKAATNLEAGKKFFGENGKREGVTTTKSGLQYEILAKGGSEKYVAPKEGDEGRKQFLVNYKGSFIDGTQFDASVEGEPAVMTLDVIDGIKETLTTMPVGAKWKVFVPADLGYGENRNGDIAPNSSLIFEIELVKIEDAPADPEGDGGFPIPIPNSGN